MNKKENSVNIKNIILDYTKIFNASLCIANDEVRYYLNGIFIKDTKDGYREYYATNGHIMYKGVCKYTGDSIGKEGIIFRTDWKSILKNRTIKNNCYISLKKYDDNYIIDDTYFNIKTIDGTFPDCNKVIPNKKELKQLKFYRYFDPIYMEKVKKIIDNFSVNEIYSTSKNFEEIEPAVFFDKENTVVLMPIRS